jgi:hypothetical protein
MAEKKNDVARGRQGYVPKPPQPADIDVVSRDQALITDEWAGEPPQGGRETVGDGETGGGRSE